MVLKNHNNLIHHHSPINLRNLQRRKGEWRSNTKITENTMATTRLRPNGNNFPHIHSSWENSNSQEAIANHSKNVNKKRDKHPALGSLILFYLKWNRALAGHSQKQHQPATIKDLKSVLYTTISNKYRFLSWPSVIIHFQEQVT